MASICIQCGAFHQEDDTCRTIFDEFLTLDFSDPAYGEVHFLTVACYMIQHNGYSDEALEWIEDKIRTYLTEELSGPEIRALVAEDMEHNNFTGNIRRKSDARPLPVINWSMTILDVKRKTHNAESYRAAMIEWGHTILEEMGPLVD